MRQTSCDENNIHRDKWAPAVFLHQVVAGAGNQSFAAPLGAALRSFSVTRDSTGPLFQEFLVFIKYAPWLRYRWFHCTRGVEKRCHLIPTDIPQVQCCKVSDIDEEMVKE